MITDPDAGFSTIPPRGFTEAPVGEGVTIEQVRAALGSATGTAPLDTFVSQGAMERGTEVATIVAAVALALDGAAAPEVEGGWTFATIGDAAVFGFRVRAAD